MADVITNYEKEYYDLKKAYDALVRVHNATNTAVESLQNDNERIKNRLAILDTEKRMWESERASQQIIIQQTLDRSNMMSNQYLEENNRLKEEIRRFKGE